MAVIDDMGITVNEYRMMKRKIESYLPEAMRPLFPTERAIGTLSDGFFEPMHGDPYYYKEDGKPTEKIEWWWKPVDKIVEEHLKKWFSVRRRRGRNAQNLDRVAVVLVPVLNPLVVGPVASAGSPPEEIDAGDNANIVLTLC